MATEVRDGGREYLLNGVESAVSDMLEGMALGNPSVSVLAGHKVLVDGARLRDAALREGTVAVISGGGSGHEPAHAGYVGGGLLAAAVCGEVFCSPATEAVVAAIVAVAGRSKGALLVVKNYTGDRLHFGLAAQIASLTHGIPCRMLLVGDDISVAQIDRRRGLAGALLVYKIAAAVAATGAGLGAVEQAAREASSRLHTISMGLSPCTLPGATPAVPWPRGAAELGLGCHGEPGLQRLQLAGPKEACRLLLERLRLSLPAEALSPSSSAVLLLNLLTALTPLEGHVLTKELLALFAQPSSQLPAVTRFLSGPFLSSLDMAGFSVTLLLDPTPEQLSFLDAPTSCAAWPAVVHPARLPSQPIYHAMPSILPTSSSAALSASSPHASTAGPSSTVSTPGAEQWLRETILAVAHHCEGASLVEELNDLDKARGDGDTGFAVQRGAKAVLAQQQALRFDHPPVLFAQIAQVVHSAMGGSSGALLGSGLHGLSAALQQRPGEPGHALQQAISMMSELGGAKAGDSTMLDALLPAVAPLSASPADWAAAAAASNAGAEATSSMVPLQGRAFYIGDKALGHVDPGARLVARIFSFLVPT